MRSSAQPSVARIPPDAVPICRREHIASADRERRDGHVLQTAADVRPARAVVVRAKHAAAGHIALAKPFARARLLDTRADDRKRVTDTPVKSVLVHLAPLSVERNTPPMPPGHVDPNPGFSETDCSPTVPKRKRTSVNQRHKHDCEVGSKCGHSLPSRIGTLIRATPSLRPC